MEAHISSLRDFVKQSRVPLLKRDDDAYDLASRNLVKNLLKEQQENSDLIMAVVEALEFEKDTVFGCMVTDVISKCIRKLPDLIQTKLSGVILQQGAFSGRSDWFCQWTALDFAYDFYDLCDLGLLQNQLHQLARYSSQATQVKVARIFGKAFDALPNKEQAYYDLRMLSEHPKKEVEFAAKSSLSLIDSKEQGMAKIDKQLSGIIQTMPQPSDQRAISILFLSADPTDASRLRLGEEIREIQEKLKLAKLREHFRLELPQLSVRPADVSQALLDTQPQIVHFSGHGTSTGALSFEDQVGEAHLVQPDALSALFEQFANQVNCVVLNACYSETQATSIAQHIDYVVGMNQAIGDKAAIAFTVGFYQALGAGRAIEEAFKLGCVQIRLQGIPEHLTPVLIRKGQAQS
jgi:hypothetical protein